MAQLGKRPAGIIVTKITKKKTYSEAEIFRHIEKRSGEYDEAEKIMLPDPYADGWQLRTIGEAFKDLKMEVAPIRLKTRQERFELIKLGWKDADAYLKRMEMNKK